jgi:hypothetical protein
LGFRSGSYATIWSVDPVSDVQTKARISVSRKNKQSGEYETEFSGFVSFFGTAAAKKAACLKEKDRIKIGDCDVKTHYDKEKNITYYNFNIFSFEVQDNNAGGNTATSTKDVVPDVDDGEIDDERLPF